MMYTKLSFVHTTCTTSYSSTKRTVTQLTTQSLQQPGKRIRQRLESWHPCEYHMITLYLRHCIRNAFWTVPPRKQLYSQSAVSDKKFISSNFFGSRLISCKLSVCLRERWKCKERDASGWCVDE